MLGCMLHAFVELSALVARFLSCRDVGSDERSALAAQRTASLQSPWVNVVFVGVEQLSLLLVLKTTTRNMVKNVSFNFRGTGGLSPCY